MPVKYKRIAMLSTHGYFDPVPRLGQTDTGGQVTYVLELSKAYSRLGIQTDIFTRWFDRGAASIDQVPGYPAVRVVRIPAGPWEFIPKEEIYPVLPELAANMADFIQSEGLTYDLFHGHYVDAGIVTLMIRDQFGKPCYFTPHSLGAWKREQMGGDPEEMDRQFRFRHRIAEELNIFRHVNGNTVTSSLQMEKLLELYPFDGRNTEVIPPGVDIHRFRPLSPGEKEAPTSLPEKYIYCLSRIDTNKGHDLLLEAFARVLQEIPDAHLVIGGGSPDPKPREIEVFDMIHSLISMHHLEGHIHFVGLVPPHLMVTYYRNARFFVMPSIFEPFGMTAQESMACSVPVVASRYGGIRTVLHDGLDGLLIDPKDTGEFSMVMIRLLREPNLREMLGKAALELIREQFSWEVVAGRHLAFYQRYHDKTS